ncbi:hypothetical protein scyTo_0024133, partial [Scyliorhinus torazame]|nr:hypothetical protein [Scyliorhinus torazame]
CELEQKLGDTKAKVSKMEDLLPKWLNNKDQQEIMSLLCKVHELEVENTEIQSALLHKENILQQKDFVIQHYEQHRALCDEIILQQRQLIDGTVNTADQSGNQNVIMHSNHCIQLSES